MILRKASILKDRAILSPSAVNTIAVDKMFNLWNLLPKAYKREEIFEADVMAEVATGVRDDVLDDPREELEVLEEMDIYEEQRSPKSDLLVNNSHDTVLGHLKPMGNTAIMKPCEKYPNEIDLIISRTRYMNDHHHLF